MGMPATRTGSLTPSQRRAVAARGNVLVMAGAGTGKTKTLVERCLDCLDRERVSLDALLIVTFTEAAAAEMRQRLRRELEKKSAAEPDDEHWLRQLALFDLAHIGTLHSFCLKLVREHFYELGLDPQLAILDEGEARQRAGETLDEQFQAHYEGEDEFTIAVQNLIHVHGGGRDENIRKLILRLHNYSQTRPDAAGWLAAQVNIFSAREPTEWQGWLLAGIQDWKAEWLPVLADLGSGNEKAAELAGILQQLEKLPTREAATEVLEQTVSADGNWPAKRKTVFRKPLEDLFDEATFLLTLAAVKNGGDPLAEDWSWVRGQMETLLRLAQEFAAEFSKMKLADGVLDFHDLEQFALKLLWDFEEAKPTATAGSWREKLHFVFVDEYQDINAAQDKIIQALSRDEFFTPSPRPSGERAGVRGFDSDANGLLTPTLSSSGGEGEVTGPLNPPVGNRFLVGDVKQSIYRFRLADPKIFRNYAHSWRPPVGETIPLLENFRSREGVLNFVNSVCGLVMREGVGGVAYDEDATLKSGWRRDETTDESDRAGGFPPAAAREDARPTGVEPCVELLLRRKAGRNETPDEDDGELAGLDESQKEARLVAMHLKQLVAQEHKIWDGKTGASRPVKWRDMMILLRSPRGKSEIFAKEFDRAGVPLAIARGRFYESAEILDLISLLQLLDNPLQDGPCIAVLRSPLVGLSLDELAEIRLVAKEKHFWTALNRLHTLAGDASVPLTPAPSPGEREKRSQSQGKATAEFCSTKLEMAKGGQRLFPLPEGEGQGEGERGANPDQARLFVKISQFLDRFSRWRKLAKQNSLSRCLEQILDETLYTDWLRAQPRGAQRAANVASLLNLAQQFDQFQRQGLFRFLKFIEAQQEAETEPEVPATPEVNAVRLMSIHQSKGLEFPVVVLADLAKHFNEQDLRGEIIFDEELGLCPKVKPPMSGRRYPSLPHWLAQRRQRRELRGEELRLLYVALTRAKENLILTATVTQKQWEDVWTRPTPVTTQKIAEAGSFADWLALWFAQNAGKVTSNSGKTPLMRWRLIEDAELHAESRSRRGDEAQTQIGNRKSEIGNEAEPPPVGCHEGIDSMLDEAALENLREKLSWDYPFKAATGRKAKSSVTALRREAEELDDEAENMFSENRIEPARTQKIKSGQRKLNAAETGAAHHRFLQHLALDKTGGLAAEADRLASEHYLSADERAALDLEAVAQFWHSDLGQNICANAEHVRRELPFTARFSPVELETLTGRKAGPELESEFVVVQGVADLVVLLPHEIWLVDFKTDALGTTGLPEKIKIYTPQLKLYAAALEKIFGRKVTRRTLHFLALQQSEEV